MAEAVKPSKESAKAREACEQYLLLGPERSLSKLAKHLGRPQGYERTLKEWSSTHEWQEKAREYDQEQAAIRRCEIEAERREMDREHAKWGKEQAMLAIQTIQGLISGGKYNPASANQLFKISTDLQRLALGSATEQIAVTGKDGKDLESDIVVVTHWGRNTDPRRKSPEPDAPAETDDDDEDQGDDISVEFGESSDDDAWEDDENP